VTIPGVAEEARDTREWQVVTMDGRATLYAVNPSGDWDVLAAGLDPALARQIAAEHRQALAAGAA
jgi:hypothetical protein